MNIAEILNFKFPEHKNHYAVWEEKGEQYLTWDEPAMGRPKPTSAELAA